MTYDLNRDGIAACPDDPMRVAAPTFLDIDEHEIDDLASDYDHQISMVLDGYRSSAKINGEAWDVDELFEAIFMVEDTEIKRLLMAYHKPTKERLIRDWCYQMAEKELIGD